MAAQRAFDRAGLKVDTAVVIVGFSDDEANGQSVSFECRGEPVRPSELDGVAARADELYTAHPRSAQFHSDPWLHDRVHAGLRRRAMASAIAEVLNANDSLARFSFFASSGAPIGGHYVHTCLGIESSKFDALPVFEHRDERFEGPPSLQHAIVTECLARADAELYQPDAGSRLSGALGGPQEIVASAAEDFSGHLVFVVAGMPNDLLSIVNMSTAHAYERAEASALLHIVNSRNGGYDLRVPLESRISLGSARALRKLLEASESNLAVIADEGCVLGLGSVSPQTLSLDIEVRGKLDWSLSAEGTTLLRSYAGEVSFPRRPLERADLADVAARTIGQCNVDRVWPFVEAARDSAHGMTLVVSSDAASEAQRLGSAAFVLDPCDLDDSDVGRLGAVDGAVLMDAEGRCHAFGIILDGEASGKGDPARGSRYNSAVRYQRAHSDTAFIVVVSVDGNVNLLPALRPRVSRTEVASAVDRFCDICAQDDPDGEDYAEALDRVRGFAFYLDADQCGRANQADEDEQQRRLEADGMATSASQFRPNPEMNDSYFVPDETS